LFSYCFLYIFPFPLSALPYAYSLTFPWNCFATNFVSFMGQYCFHLVADSSNVSNGSGDQLFRYIEIASYALISLPVAIIWTLLDRKRGDYSRLFEILRLWALLFVASSMLGYGASKIIPSQFPPLNDWQLSQRLGDKSPMGMLWTFMSTSSAYTIFTGAVEFSAGLLLAYPGSTILGALLSVAVCSQIFALNMCYDVPVKILSFHLLMFSVLIVSPAIPDLVRLFVLHKTARPFEMLKPFKQGLLNLGSWTFVWLFLLCTAVIAFGAANALMIGYHRSAGQTKLAGTWEIVTSSCDNPELERYIKMWRFISNNYKNVIQLTSKDKQQIYLHWHFSDDGNKVDISSGRWKAHFGILKQGATSIEMKGTICGATATLSLAKLSRAQEYPLTERGFHLVNEVPYNR
jgi:hypothetical protein